MFNKKIKLNEVRKVVIQKGVSLSIETDGNGNFFIKRFSKRGKITNVLQNYEFIDKTKNSHLKPLTLNICNKILDRAEQKMSYSSLFIFYAEDLVFEEHKEKEKSIQEHKYTSTGIKFWRHQKQMIAYQNGKPNTVISTHISPEGACNLKCPYCSVTYRDTHSRLELDLIKDYIEKLQSRGLKAVILTGGGEPTAYKYFNELVCWLKYERNLNVALITNGTLGARIHKDSLNALSWLRVSINLFNGWEERIGKNLKIQHLNENCIVGCSMVYTVEHESTEEIMTNRIKMFKKVSKIADKINSKYIRLLPNCLLDQKHLLVQHQSLSQTLMKVDDKRFFHQYKVHGTPSATVCHQSYFRPYLSEETFGDTQIAGTVYPCDSVVLNDSYQYFAKEYQLCRPEDILKYLDGELKPKFSPKERCKGCVFTENVNMLEKWKNKKINRFMEFSTPITHEDFV